MKDLETDRKRNKNQNKKILHYKKLHHITWNITWHGIATVLTHMCCRSLLLTGYRTQFVPTSFTAHSMSMLVTIPHWLSCNTSTIRHHSVFFTSHSIHVMSHVRHWTGQWTVTWLTIGRLMEKRKKSQELKYRVVVRERLETLLTLELFRRTMSLMTIDRSSSFSWKRKRYSLETV